MGVSSSCLSIASKSKLKHYSQEIVNKNAININEVTEEELLFLPGITRQLARNITDYRQINHAFNEIDDLLQVPGITLRVLKKISGDITITQRQTSLSFASFLSETVPIEFQKHVLASFSVSRPSAISNNDKQKTFRCASWNLQQLTYDKVQNFGVREVICRIILEHNFSLIAVQDIVDTEALQCIVDELNHPVIPVIKSWSRHRAGKWKCLVSDIVEHSSQKEYLGFIYNEAMGMELLKETLVPYSTVFRMHNQMELVFVNLHLKTRNSDEDEAKSLELLIKTIEQSVGGKHVILFGTFNNISTAAQFQSLTKYHYLYVTDQNTDIHLQRPQGSICADNIWLSVGVQALRTENSGVIREHLTNPWIPSGWQWCALASDHCPIWMELNFS